MIFRYRILTERLQAELRSLQQVVQHVAGALTRATKKTSDQDYFITAAAFDLHSFYTGLEHLFQIIATEIDSSSPAGPHWHRDLLEQMSLAITDLRPAVIAPKTRVALEEYLSFRHVVRNVYTFNLRSERVIELSENLPSTFNLVQHDLLAFIEFLEELAQADTTE